MYMSDLESLIRRKGEQERFGVFCFFKEEGQSSTPPARLRSPAESLSAITTSDPDL